MQTHRNTARRSVALAAAWALATQAGAQPAHRSAREAAGETRAIAGTAARSALAIDGSEIASGVTAAPAVHPRSDAAVEARSAEEAPPRSWRAAPEVLAEALGLVGLRPEQFKLDTTDASFFGGGAHLQQVWKAFAESPLNIESDTKTFRRTLTQGATSASSLVQFGTVRLREGVRRGLIGSPLRPSHETASGPHPLASAIEALSLHGGRRLSARQRARLRRQASALPEELALPAALLVGALPGVLDWMERAFVRVPPEERARSRTRMLRALAGDGIQDEPFASLAREMAGRIDFKSLYAGAADLALALDGALEGLPEGSTGARTQDPSGRTDPSAPPPRRAIPGLRGWSGERSTASSPGESADLESDGRGKGDAPKSRTSGNDARSAQRDGPASHSTKERAGRRERGPKAGTARRLAPTAPRTRREFRASTPYGDIVIAGDADDRHEGTALLIIDTGGNDTYSGASDPSLSSLSIIIDLGGDDIYGGSAGGAFSPSAGSGVLGYGMVFDREGADRYLGSGAGQGAGVFGVGLLLDGAGDDRYAADLLAQGAGVYGLGVLSDAAGSDTYFCGHQCQGFGFTGGMGILVDREGDDRYIADDELIRFPSPQTPEHNTSLAQGCGVGRRADYSDGHSTAGGIGLLIDGAGDDHYSAGLFAQGAAYWYGVGLLDDAAGNDRYEGVWYVQGSAAHFGIGVLVDEGGDDSYRATMNMAQGAGHDFSWGQLLDESGDDRYEAPNLSLGGGNDNGIGFFWDRAGDDTYTVKGDTALGRANITSARGGLRDRMLCLGLFLDTGGGRDVYSKPFAGDDRGWIQRGRNVEEPLDAEKGVGLDR